MELCPRVCPVRAYRQTFSCVSPGCRSLSCTTSSLLRRQIGREKCWTLDAVLERMRDPLTEGLHAEIHEQAGNQRVQRVLISLKRDIYNARAPRDAAAAREATAVIQPALQHQVAEWLEAMNERAELTHKGEKILDREIEQKRRILKSAARDPDFRKGMLLASPNFERSLDVYLDSSDQGLNRRLRLAERSTLLYLLRTACKTSPFSTLTAVAHGRFEGTDSDASPERPLRVPNMEKRSVSRLNVAVLSRVSAALLACCELLDLLPLRMKPDCQLDGNRIRFSRRMVTFLDDAEPLTMSVKEASFQLPLSATLRALYDVMSGGCELSMHQLAEFLAAKSGAGLKEIEDLLRVFVGLDLLFAPRLRPVLNSIDPAENYCEKLESLGVSRLGPALDLLRDASESANLYGTSSLSERPRQLQEIGRQLTGVFEQIDAPGAQLPQTLVYEDCTVTGGHLRANETEWRSMGGSLAAFQRLLPLFDTMLPPRMAMKGVFRVLWGEGRRCDDVRAFAELFYQDYHAPYWRAQSDGGITDESGNLRPALNVFHSPEITLLDRGRQEFADYLRSRSAEDAGAYEITLSSEALLQIAERLPATVPALQSHSFFAQPALTADGSWLVLNNVYGGLTQMMSRFVHLFEASGNTCLPQGPGQHAGSDSAAGRRVRGDSRRS